MADRILTTHVGSLPRSAAVTDLVFAQERGEPVDAAQFSAVIGEAVDDAVARQIASGVDLVSDGEMSKISYATYIKDRITGFDGDSEQVERVNNLIVDLERTGTFTVARLTLAAGQIRDLLDT